jgi:CelD/BcsL family acetyltransferase involved in cellulose biosynthesis
MQTFEWASACAHAFTNGELRLLTSGQNGTIGFAPLFFPSGEKFWTLLGTELYEVTDFTYADPGAAEMLSAAVLDWKFPVFLRSVNVDSPVLLAFRKLCRGRRVMVTRPMPGSPWMELDESWREPESHLNSGRRSDLRRARRNAERLGPVRIDFSRPRPEDLNDLLAVIYRLENANWKGRTGSSLQANPEIGEFYRHYARTGCKQGFLHLGFMWIGDEPVAAQLAVEHDNRFWLLKMGFDDQYQKCSPGTLLMAESLRYAANLGYQTYEILGVSAPWNQLWTRQCHERVSVRIYAHGFSGLSTFAGDWFSYVSRTMRRHLWD